MTKNGTSNSSEVQFQKLELLDHELAVEKMEGGGTVSKDILYVSGDKQRPLKYTDVLGNVYQYFESPMYAAAIFILLLEGFERFAYYVIQPEFPKFLVNPVFGNMSQADASSLISVSSGLSYVWPIVGGVVADSISGTYRSILGFALIYLVALVLLCVMGAPEMYADWMSPVFFYGLLPLGMGGVKALISVMGANQFHPVMHKDQISSFYLKFYMVINIFACLSTAVNAYVNTVGDEMWKPFLFPVVAFAVGMTIFIVSSSRYVDRKPLGSAIAEVAVVTGHAFTLCPPSLDKQRESLGGNVKDTFVDDTLRIGSLVPFLLIGLSFFNLAYSYLANYMIYQGMEMFPTWGVESNVLNSAINPLCIIGFGALLDWLILPALRKRNMEPTHMNKMIFGCMCAFAAMLWQVLLEYLIKDGWTSDRSQIISIFAQVPCYALIGLGEIFVNPVGYDLAYSIAPQSFKGLAQGLSVFFVGAVPNFFAGALAKATVQWQTDANGCTSRFDENCPSNLVDPSTGEAVWDYPTTNMQNLYWVAAGVALAGIVLLQFVGKPMYNKFLPPASTESTENGPVDTSDCATTTSADVKHDDKEANNSNNSQQVVMKAELQEVSV